MYGSGLFHFQHGAAALPGRQGRLTDFGIPPGAWRLLPDWSSRGQHGQDTLR